MQEATARPLITKMAKNCKACRISKVKCQVTSSSTCCARCERLGLECIFMESKRGQSCIKRDRARLGPAARALLRATAPDEEEGDGGMIEGELARTRDADAESFCWNGSECQRKMVQSISNGDGQLALLKHWLLIGVRSGNCGVLGNILLLAHACNVALDQIILVVNRPLPPAPSEPELPSFIREWIDDANRVCCVRSQVYGAISWRPNAAFVREVGNEAALRDMLCNAHPDVSGSVDYLVCTAERKPLGGAFERTPRLAVLPAPMRV